jgi:hypothetical protein
MYFVATTGSLLRVEIVKSGVKNHLNSKSTIVQFPDPVEKKRCGRKWHFKKKGHFRPHFTNAEIRMNRGNFKIK